MDNDGNNMFAHAVRAGLNQADGQAAIVGGNPVDRLAVFAPISIIDQIYACAFAPENANQYLQKIMDYFNADGVLLAISKRFDESMCFYCAVGEVNLVQSPSNSTGALLCNAENQTLVGSLILFANPQNQNNNEVTKKELDQLQPHFARSLDISRYLNFEGDADEKLVRLIDAIEAPLGIANQYGEILAINFSGREILYLHSHAEFETDNRWRAGCEEAVVKGKHDVEFRRNGKEFVARLNALAAGTSGAETRKIIINFQHQKQQEKRDFSSLKLAYDLTQAECEILELLFKGHSASKIAQIRKSSRDTVRVQLRTIKEKTGTKSQIDLIAFVRAILGGKNA